MPRAWLVAIILLATLSQSSAQVTGRATVLDSDRLLLGGEIFHLAGIDGVEFHQFCFVDGRPWACGASGTRALQTLLDPVLVTCAATGETAGEAKLAVCTSSEGDIAEMMVAQGWALADRARSDNYVAAEEAARAAGLGVWQGVLEEPWAFRDDIAAIGQAATARSVTGLLDEAEQALLSDRVGVGVLDGFSIARAASPAAAVTVREFAIAGLGPSPVADAIEERDVFTWAAVARSLADWRRLSVAAVLAMASDLVWDDLAARPNRVIEVDDSEAYYAAMIEQAAAWREQGRQPILLLTSPAVPSWIGDWFSGSPPAGAEITLRDVADAGYIGTVDGIDVYAGRAPETASLLFPNDLLISIVYDASGEGILEVARDADTDPNLLIIRFALVSDWMDDAVIWLSYPPEEAAGLYDS